MEDCRECEVQTRVHCRELVWLAMIGMAIVVSLLEKRDSKRRFSGETDLETSNMALGKEKSAPVLVAGGGGG